MSECGTTYCIAGWACIFSGKTLRWAEDGLAWGGIGRDDPLHVPEVA